MASMEERNKTLVLEAFNTLFNKRHYEAALQFVPAAGMSPFGAVRESGIGTNRTNWTGLTMSVDRGRPEVTDGASNRRY
jgi:hypothetical protein